MDKNGEPVGKIVMWAWIAFGCMLLLGMPDTAMAELYEQFLRDRRPSALFCAAIVVFAIQWFVPKRRGRWVLPILFSACLLLVEGIWLTGGWNRVLSIPLWMAGFPGVIGSGLAEILRDLPKRSGGGKTAVVAVLTAAVVLWAVFWPRLLNEKIDMEPQTEVYYFEEGEGWWETLRDPQQTLDSIFYIQVSPSLYAPQWDCEPCALLRLNAEYVLVAQPMNSPYIYRYSGPLEEFDGEGLKWKVLGWSAMYSNLRTDTTP